VRLLPGVVRTPQLFAQRDELIRQSLAALGAELEQAQARGLGGVARRLPVFALRASGHFCLSEAPDLGFDSSDRPAQPAHLQGRRVQLALWLIGFLAGARRDVERDAQPHGHGRRPAGLSDALESANRALLASQSSLVHLGCRSVAPGHRRPRELNVAAARDVPVPVDEGNGPVRAAGRKEKRGQVSCIVIHRLAYRAKEGLNRRHDRVGHVFQGRYKGVLVERESHLLELVRYVVLNPVRARMCRQPRDRRWSSYSKTAGLRGAASRRVERDVVFASSVRKDGESTTDHGQNSRL